MTNDKQKSDTERVRIICALMDAGRDRFARRVTYQWRVCFATWSTLALAVGFFATTKEPHLIQAAWGVLILLGTTWLFGWLFLPWTSAADQGDKEIHAFWERKLELLLDERSSRGRPLQSGTDWLRRIRKIAEKSEEMEQNSSSMPNGPSDKEDVSETTDSKRWRPLTHWANPLATWWPAKGYRTQFMITIAFASAAAIVPFVRWWSTTSTTDQDRVSSLQSSVPHLSSLELSR